MFPERRRPRLRRLPGIPGDPAGRQRAGATSPRIPLSPLVPGLRAELERGIDVADVGWARATLSTCCAASSRIAASPGSTSPTRGSGSSPGRRSGVSRTRSSLFVTSQSPGGGCLRPLPLTRFTTRHAPARYWRNSGAPARWDLRPSTRWRAVRPLVDALHDRLAGAGRRGARHRVGEGTRPRTAR